MTANPRPSKRIRRDESDRISFSSQTRSPYNLLSNFHGGAELHYMAARFENESIRRLLVETFANCTVAEFRNYFALLHPRGKAETYIKHVNGVKTAARGILGKLAGSAVIRKSAEAKRRMKVLKQLAGVPEDEEVKANTDRILKEAGDVGKTEAIDAFNERLIRECLKRKFRTGHCEAGVEFRELLKGTKGRLREAGRGKWAGSGEEDGLLGKMLVELREQIRREDEDAHGHGDQTPDASVG